jgi:hypothetical protein
MAGFRRLYCIGGLGGFQGADGLNPIEFQILIGQGDRFWLESMYHNNKIKPIGSIKIIVPTQEDHSYALIDACIAFAPKYFTQCPSLQKVSELLKDHKRLDLDLGQDKIPESWYVLRKEAIPIFEELNIFQGNLLELDASKKYPKKLGVFPPGL